MSCRNVFSDRKLHDLFLVCCGYVSGCCWLKLVYCLSGRVVLRHRWTIRRNRIMRRGHLFSCIGNFLLFLSRWFLHANGIFFVLHELYRGDLLSSIGKCLFFVRDWDLCCRLWLKQLHQL